MKILLLIAQGLVFLIPLATAKINRDTALITLATEIVKATTKPEK